MHMITKLQSGVPALPLHSEAAKPALSTMNTTPRPCQWAPQVCRARRHAHVSRHWLDRSNQKLFLLA